MNCYMLGYLCKIWGTKGRNVLVLFKPPPVWLKIDQDQLICKVTAETVLPYVPIIR